MIHVFDMYGLLMAAFPLGFYVNSNFITESGALIDLISCTARFHLLENQSQAIRIKLKPFLLSNRK